MTGGELEILGNEEQAFGEAGFDGEVEKTLPAISAFYLSFAQLFHAPIVQIALYLTFFSFFFPWRSCLPRCMCAETIRPVENSFAQFRGDSYHRVRGYGTATSRQRVSLVLEQYSIAEENERFLLEYEQSEKNGMTMM